MCKHSTLKQSAGLAIADIQRPVLEINPLAHFLGTSQYLTFRRLWKKQKKMKVQASSAEQNVLKRKLLLSIFFFSEIVDFLAF